MGEAKRRKEQGLPPRIPKKESKPKSSNLLVKYPRLPLWIGLVFGIFLVWDLMRTYS
ncbi:hypothetical protein EV05_0038 [Prochlorococcus sp. MIT 0601]|nr:hypothetical protein EV05_0038 [Prochlorococcus sp. MIT 0601]